MQADAQAEAEAAAAAWPCRVGGQLAGGRQSEQRRRTQISSRALIGGPSLQLSFRRRVSDLPVTEIEQSVSLCHGKSDCWSCRLSAANGIVQEYL